MGHTPGDSSSPERWRWYRGRGGATSQAAHRPAVLEKLPSGARIIGGPVQEEAGAGEEVSSISLFVENVAGRKLGVEGGKGSNNVRVGFCFI